MPTAWAGFNQQKYAAKRSALLLVSFSEMFDGWCVCEVFGLELPPYFRGKLMRLKIYQGALFRFSPVAPVANQIG